MISKACKYAIRATVYVASKGNGERCNVKEIAKSIDAPEAFTAKTLQILNKHRIITSVKGPYGGFYIEKQQMAVPIIDIVNAVDGLSIFRECGLGFRKCSENHPCPMHAEYAIIRNKLLKTFRKTTIADLASDIKNGVSYITN